MSATDQPMKTIPIIGLDFIDFTGKRIVSFQLCTRTEHGVESVADCLIEDGVHKRTLAIDSLVPSIPAIQRLASRYARRSFPIDTRRHP